MKLSKFCLLITLIGLMSCAKDDAPIIPDPEPSAELNLKNLSEGQTASYVRLDGICGFDDMFNYTQDTLILEIIDQDGDLYFQESFTEGSPLYEFNPDPVAYPVIKEQDMILIPERDRSTLFFFYGNDTIKTAPQHEITLVQESCQQLADGEPFRGDLIAYLPTFDLHDISLREQTVVSCVPIIIDLEAFLCYKDGRLNLSYTLSSGFPGITFQGWKLLE
jgi:hypothetical protein